jgi:hypothetical protein
LIGRNFDRTPPLTLRLALSSLSQRPFIEKLSRLPMSCGSFPFTPNLSVLVWSSAFGRGVHSQPNGFHSTRPTAGLRTIFRGFCNEDSSSGFYIAGGNGCVRRYRRECMGLKIGKGAKLY